MKTIIGALAAILLIGSTGSAQIKDYTGRLDPKRGFVRIGVAVEDFIAAEGTQLSSTDSITLVRVSQIIRGDIDFSPFHDIVVLDSFYLRHMELRTMTLLAWTQLGAEYVIKGDGEFSGNEVALRYELFSAKSGQSYAKGKIRSLASNYRHLAHRLANEIIYYLTGEPGIFDSRICFISNRTGNKELYLCDYDGANVYQLTRNGSINVSPAFSPDGQTILFTSYMKDQPQLYQYRLSSGAVDPIASYPGLNTAARVSPDGKSMVCTLSRDGNPEIYILESNGKIKRRLTYSPATETSPCWSPTGKQVAFTSDRTGQPQIYVMDADGSNLQRLTFVGKYNDSPDWSPKGDKIAFVSRVDRGFNICTIDVTGDNFKVLTELGNNENPHWSPDGNHVVFSSTRTGAEEVYIMDLYGNEEKRLTTGGGNSSPAWSGYTR
jgi:TolB protein